MAQEISLTVTSPGPSFPLPRCFPPIVWPCWCWSLVSSSYDSGAPTIHPMSSCSSAWQWVLHHPSFIAAMEGAMWGPEAVPCCCGALVLVPHCHRCPLSSTRPTQPASRCLQWLEWVVGRRCHVGGVERISVTWRAYGGCWVLTGWVSPFWGLSASLCALLAHVDSLTSYLNGEEGVLVAMGVRCAFFVVAGRHQ
jgi:hypothetical protein